MRKPIFIIAATLLLLGAGCYQALDKVGTGVVTPIAVPLNALESSKQKLGDIQANLNRQGETAADDQTTVALVLTENTLLPSGAVLGKIFGCNDRVAFAKVKRLSDTGDAMRDALTSLLASKDPSFAGLYNGLAFSTLEVSKTVRAADGTAEVRLRGRIVSGGTCDDPRIKTQIEETIRRLEPKFRIVLNDTESAWRCLGDMSGKCN